MRKNDFLDKRTTFPKHLVDRVLSCLSQAQKRNVVTSREPRQQLGRCFAAVASIEAWREGCTDEESASEHRHSRSVGTHPGDVTGSRGDRRRGGSASAESDSSLRQPPAKERFALVPAMSDTPMCVRARDALEHSG